MKEGTARACMQKREQDLSDSSRITEPYEPPDDADGILDTSDLTPEEAAQEIFLHLERQGFIGANG